MEKVARKTSTDPVQEKLRKDKDLWNKEVSRFIESVKQLKKTMNGYPSKIAPMKGNIKDPIPGNPASALDALTTAFEQIAEHGNAIVEEQLAYSKGRRKKQPKQPGMPQAPAPVDTSTPTPAPAMTGADLSQQLSGALANSSIDGLVKLADEYEDLVVEGSNPLTRFWSKLKSPPIGWGNKAQVRRNRANWLNYCAKTFKLLEKFQVQIVKGSNSSIPQANQFSNDAWRQWGSVFKAYKDYLESIGQKTIDDPIEGLENGAGEGGDSFDPDSVPPTKQKTKPKPAAPPSIEQPQISEEDARIIELANQVFRDYRQAINDNAYPESPVWGSLNPAIVNYRMAPKNNNINQAKALLQEFNNAIQMLNAAYGVNATSLTGVEKARKAKEEQEKTSTAQLEVVAQDFLKKWLGKSLRQMSMSSIANERLRLYEKAERLREKINKVMDLLEKGLNTEELTPLMFEVNREMNALRSMMINFNALHHKKEKVKK